MSKLKDGCVKPVVGPILEGADQPSKSSPGIIQEVKKVLTRVGKEAIDFEASAFVSGEGFKPVRLSDYRGKWIVICFYPGDFTYV
jgi:peroxiredoxin (alkyl hydroperoxide reductase subunit C)